MNGNNLAMKPNDTYLEYTKLKNNEEFYYEFEFGEIVALASPTPKHQLINGNLVFILKKYFAGKSCKVIPEVDCNLHNDDSLILRPDISVVCKSSQIGSTQILGAPTMVIEILSPSTERRDLITKRRFYQDAGVKEYWIVDPDTDSVEVIKYEDAYKGAYLSSSVIYLDRLTSTVFDNLVVELKEIFEDRE